MKESDWKKFKKIKADALDLFCTRVFGDVDAVINRKNESAHERYLELYKVVHEADRKIKELFEGHSRNRAFIQLMLIRREGLAEEAQIDTLSDELRDDTAPRV